MKKSFNFGYPICTRRTRMPRGFDGDCSLNRGKFIIRIDSSLPEYYAIDVLLHELSHCLAWEKEEDIHGPSWGVAYSEIYRKYLEWHEKEI